jgi:hypothetical protein
VSRFSRAKRTTLLFAHACAAINAIEFLRVDTAHADAVQSVAIEAARGVYGTNQADARETAYADFVDTAWGQLARDVATARRVEMESLETATVAAQVGCSNVSAIEGVVWGHSAAERNEVPCSMARSRSFTISWVARTDRYFAYCRLPSHRFGIISAIRNGEGGIRTPGRVLPLHRFSKPAHSTTLPPLQIVHEAFWEKRTTYASERRAGFWFARSRQCAQNPQKTPCRIGFGKASGTSIFRESNCQFDGTLTRRATTTPLGRTSRGKTRRESR